jgi:hypothetical protein
MISTTKKLIGGTLLLATSGAVLTAPIDLNSFQQVGGGNENWVVSADGTSVLQTVNASQPSAFVSQDEFFNTQFTGSFGVETSLDDDYIGFVFGFDADDSTPFYLFDWRQGAQNGNEPGFYLSEVTGGLVRYMGEGTTGINYNPHHEDAPGYQVLATDLGTGWADNTVYDFTLEYTESLIKIDIAGGAFGSGQTIFELSGLSNTSGRFGFYNSSQADVRYQGFTEEIAPSVPEPGTLGLMMAGLVGLGGARRRRR